MTKSYSWTITSNTFKYHYLSAHFGPTVIWNPGGEEQPFQRSEATLPFDPFKFKAFVSEDQSFATNFSRISSNWVNSEESKNILKARFDTSDPYFNSLASTYVLSTLSGVCKKHFKNQEGVPPIITSILCYFLYYHMACFSCDPSRLDTWLEDENYEKIQSLVPTKAVWEQRYVYGSKEIPSY